MLPHISSACPPVIDYTGVELDGTLDYAHLNHFNYANTFFSRDGGIFISLATLGQDNPYERSHF